MLNTVRALAAGFAIVMLAGFATVAPIGTAPVQAQELDDVQYLLNPRLMIERNRVIRNAVKQAVGKRLAPGPGGAANGTVIAASGLTVTPSAATSDPMWSAWVDGTFTNIDDDNPARGFSSDQASISAAIDYQATDRILLGALFNFTDSRTRNVSVPGISTTEGYSGGAYVGAVVTNEIIFDASFLYTFTDNFSRDLAPVVTANYDSEGWALNANLTGYWYMEALRLSPSLGFSYSRARDDAHVDSAATALPSVVTRTGTITFGMTTGYTFALDDASTAEPYITLEGEWEFEEETSPATSNATVPPDSRDFDVRLAGGIDFALANNISLTVRGDVGGLARKNYRTLSAGGQVAIRF